jgi:pimeloyl-ACP methyl ester carboxylesterase
VRQTVEVNFVGIEGVLDVGARRIGWMVRGPHDGRRVGWFHGQPGSRKDVRAFTEETLERAKVQLFAVDRAGYGDTSFIGAGHSEDAADLLAVADSLGVGEFPVMGVSMGGIYALALAALAPHRITRAVLIAGHVLPYEDPEVVASLSDAEQADLALLRSGRTPELEQAYAAEAASAVADPMRLLQQLAASWHPRERQLVATAWGVAVAESVAFGLSTGSAGYLEDGLRTAATLDVDMAAITCPVRAVHGTIDDLEPYANLERLANKVADLQIVALPGLGHFGPWLWPDLGFAVLTGP